MCTRPLHKYSSGEHRSLMELLTMNDLNRLNDPRPIGMRGFLDGYIRVVYLDDDSRQFVLDDDGLRVYGVWLAPADEPFVVEATVD
jgi:hypothetical protein